MKKLVPVLLACGLTPISVGEAQAQSAPSSDGPHGVVAIGPGVVPEFDGSRDMRVLPSVMADVRWGGVNVQVRGPGLRVDVVSDPRLSFGPVIGARLPRDDADGRLGLLPEIDTAIEAGAFIGYRFGGDRYGQGALQMELSVLHDVSDTHNGLLATASASYTAVSNQDFFFSIDVQTTVADSDYRSGCSRRERHCSVPPGRGRQGYRGRRDRRILVLPQIRDHCESRRYLSCRRYRGQPDHGRGAPLAAGGRRHALVPVLSRS